MTLRSTSWASNLRSSSSRSSCSAPVAAIDQPHLLAFLEEDALEPDVGVDLHHVVIDQEALADGPLVLVAEDDVLEVAGGMGGGRGGEADADGVEVVERVAPDRKLLAGVAADAAPEVTEEWKWGTAVWVHTGNVVAAGAFKDHVKLNFFKGATLEDPSGLFNAGFEAKATRAIDFHQGDKINVAALNELVRAAVALNASGGKKKQK